MSDIERQELVQLETVIERGLQTFYEVGMALLEIRERRLYRQEFHSFEAYCADRWNMSKPHAHRMIAAVGVVQNLVPLGTTLPNSEAQTRPLRQLDPEQQREAWQRAVESVPDGSVPTPGHVQSIVDEMRGKVAPESPHVLTNGKSMDVHYSSATPEWHTPPHILSRVIEVFGAIDLDPCSNSHETPNVSAAMHYTFEDNGLHQQWYGRVYMNPPYGDEIGEWVGRLAQAYETKEITAGIALLPARTDTVWFRKFKDHPRCFLWGRLKFSGAENSAPYRFIDGYLWHSPHWRKEGDTWAGSDPRRVSVPDEQTLYTLLGLPYIPPDQRDGTFVYRREFERSSHHWGAPTMVQEKSIKRQLKMF